MRLTSRRLVAWAIIVVVMIVPTVLLFGPLGGFHHHYGFGLFRYMILNGEDPDPRYFCINGYEVWFSPLTFAITVATWVGTLALTVFGVRAFRGTA